MDLNFDALCPEDGSDDGSWPAADDLASAMDFLSNIKTFDQYKGKRLRDFRKEFQRVMKLAEMDMFNAKTEAEYRKESFARRNEKNMMQRLKAQDRHWIETTALRKNRIESLQKLCEKEEDRKLLGNVAPDGIGGEDGEGRGPEADIKLLQNGDVGDPSNPADGDSGKPRELRFARSCYTCKVRYNTLHHFYDQLCPSCAVLNYEKRFNTVELPENFTAVVTGGRVKIGHRIVLKLLRAGAKVIVTSR